MKRTIKEAVEVNELLSLYGSLLTPRQRKMTRDCYACDLSLSEIAKELKISRSAVSDALRRSVAKLRLWEKRLGFRRAFKELKEGAGPEKMKLIGELEEKLKHGI